MFFYRRIKFGLQVKLRLPKKFHPRSELIQFKLTPIFQNSSPILSDQLHWTVVILLFEQTKQKTHRLLTQGKNRTCDNLCCPFPPMAVNNRFKGAVHLITGLPYDKCRLINPFFMSAFQPPYLTAWQRGTIFYCTTFGLERVCVYASMMEVI